MTKRKYIQKKLKISERQKCSLMEIYDKYRYLTPKQVNALALILNLDTTQIRDWFNNERQKIRINVTNNNNNNNTNNNSNNNNNTTTTTTTTTTHSTYSINNTNNKRQQTSRAVSAPMSTTPIQLSSDDTQSSNSSTTKCDNSDSNSNLSPQIISSSLVKSFKIYKLTDNNQLIDHNNNNNDVNKNDSGSYATASALLLEETTKNSENSNELFKLNIDKTKLDELKLTFSLSDICNNYNHDDTKMNDTSLNVIKYNRFIDDNNDDMNYEDYDMSSSSSSSSSNTGRTGDDGGEQN